MREPHGASHLHDVAAIALARHRNHGGDTEPIERERRRHNERARLAASYQTNQREQGAHAVTLSGTPPGRTALSATIRIEPALRRPLGDTRARRHGGG